MVLLLLISCELLGGFCGLLLGSMFSLSSSVSGLCITAHSSLSSVGISAVLGGGDELSSWYW